MFYCFFVDFDFILGFPNQFPGIRSLDLSYINSKEQFLEQMVPALSAFPNLEEINLEGIVKYPSLFIGFI